jgi:hypothetical protein
MALGLVSLLLVPVIPAAAANGFPPLPTTVEGRFLTNLTAPVLDPGTHGTVTARLHDPLSGPLTNVTLTAEVYAFEPFPGGAANNSLPGGGGVVIAGANAASPTVIVAGGTLGPGTETSVAFDVVSLASAPAGAYALWFLVTFVSGGVEFGLASRGYFPAPVWANATSLPGGNSTLNLSRLGVSGVLPETAVQVVGASVNLALYFLLGLSLVLAAAGGFYAFRRGPKSRSGAAPPPEESRAPNALGKSRTSEGD